MNIAISLFFFKKKYNRTKPAISAYETVYKDQSGRKKEPNLFIAWDQIFFLNDHKYLQHHLLSSVWNLLTEVGKFFLIVMLISVMSFQLVGFCHVMFCSHFQQARETDWDIQISVSCVLNALSLSINFLHKAWFFSKLQHVYIGYFVYFHYVHKYDGSLKLWIGRLMNHKIFIIICLKKRNHIILKNGRSFNLAERKKSFSRSFQI